MSLPSGFIIIILRSGLAQSTDERCSQRHFKNYQWLTPPIRISIFVQVGV
jgi:hypothetical protein